MKKLLALLMVLVCLYGIAYSESPATPTDLVEIEDDDYGAVTIKLERKVYIVVDKRPKFLGDTVILTAVLVDFKTDDLVTFRWQYSAANLPDWIFIDDATEQTYTFVIDASNRDYWYRVLVEWEGD